MKRYLVILFISMIYNQNNDSLESNQMDYNDDAWKMNLYFLGGGILPLGQLENNKPLKALSLGTMKAYWLKEIKKSSERDDISERNRSFWWLVFLHFYGIIDAYVDSHMEEFPETINNNLNEENE